MATKSVQSIASETTQNVNSVLPTSGFSNVVLEQAPEIKKPNLTKLLSSVNQLITRKGSIVGAYYRTAQALPINRVNFNDQSYVPSAQNSNINNNIRRDIGPNMIGFQYHCPEFVANQAQFRVDVMADNAPYIGNQLSMVYPDAVAGEQWLNEMVEIYRANKVLSQSQFTNWDGGVTTCFSLFDILALCGTGNSHSIDEVKANLAGSLDNNKVVYTPGDSTNYNDSIIEAVGQLKTLEEYMANPNSYFLPKNYSSTGALVAGSATPEYCASDSLVKVCTPKFLEMLKVVNFALYKEWTEEITTGSLIVLPLTSFGTGSNVGTSTIAPLEQFDYTLTDTQVLIFNKSSFVQLSYPTIASTKEYYVNNITDSKFRNECIWNLYEVDGAVAIFDFGTSMNTIAQPVLEMKKSS